MTTEKKMIDPEDLIEEFEWLESQVSESSKEEIREIIQRIKSFPTVPAVVLPCKPGATVYVYTMLADPDLCSECHFFRWGGMGDSHECGKTRDGFRAAECIVIEEWTATLGLILGWIRCNEFGKSVFLTREAAESTLSKMRGVAEGAVRKCP